jgi:hypothetical protein
VTQACVDHRRLQPLPFDRVAGEVVRGEGLLSIEVVNVLQVGEQGEECFAKQVRRSGAVRRALDVLGELTI